MASFSALVPRNIIIVSQIHSLRSRLDLLNGFAVSPLSPHINGV